MPTSRWRQPSTDTHNSSELGEPGELGELLGYWEAMPSPDETPPQTARAGRVTALRPTKRDPDRIAVDLDGSFAFALPATLVGDERIEIGDLLEIGRAHV